jgi:hypothetical protein
MSCGHQLQRLDVIGGHYCLLGIHIVLGELFLGDILPEIARQPLRQQQARGNANEDVMGVVPKDDQQRFLGDIFEWDSLAKT